MKILFDHQVFSWQQFGGISRYFIELISNLPSNVNAEIAIQYSNNEYLKNSGLKRPIDNLFEPIDHFMFGLKFPGRRTLFKYITKNNIIYYPDAYELNKQISIELLKKQDFDIFHPTFYDDYFLDYIGSKPYVLDVHDMIHEFFPEMLKDPETARRKAILVNKASHIIAVSENTKKDLIDFLSVPANKISVIYRGNTFNNCTQSQISNSIPQNYLLFVGERSNYKNFLFLLYAIEPILHENTNLHLLCTGTDFDYLEKQYISSLNIASQVIASQVNDKDLFTLYSNAKAFIFPSYYEGFGLPILEAFQAGCPVLLSNTSCFPEIAGNAALYFDPKNIKEIRNVIRTIIQNEELRKDLIAKGKEYSTLFSWELSAKKTYEVYKNIIVS
jgi:glycosyltransferase involved in cell wall biosynthesis